MSTTLSLATTTTAASATPSCTANIYVLPVTDAACAVPAGGNHTEIMTKCCGDADVVSYYDNCGLFCLAKGQSVGSLTKCLQENGAGFSSVFCNQANTTLSATGDNTVPTSAGASVVATGAGSKTTGTNGGSGGNGGGNGGSGTQTGSTSGSTSTNAAAGLRPDTHLSVTGLAIGSVLFSAMAFGSWML